MEKKNSLTCVNSLALVALFTVIASAQTQAPSTGKTAEPPFSGKALTQAIAQVDGCLGVDAGTWRSGKETIIAWFEDKDAVVAWYDSDMHMQIMQSFSDNDGTHEPLEFVSDDSGPIMIMATLTFADKPGFDGLRLPVSQISVEMFAPLPGGAHLGGRLAPPAFKVPHMHALAEEALEPAG